MKNKWANKSGLDQRIMQVIFRYTIPRSIDNEIITPKICGAMIANVYNQVELTVTRGSISSFLLNWQQERTRR